MAKSVGKRGRKREAAVPPDGWLSQGQAAEMLGKARLTVMAMVTRGELESTVFAGRTFISYSSVEKHLTAMAG